MAIASEILDAAEVVLARNGIDPRHPSFGTPAGRGAAFDLLASKGIWDRPACAGVVRALAVRHGHPGILP